MFADYYKQHDRYLADSRDDWQTVGDIAYRDDEGYYYICDRKKDMIISGGMNIYPAEIEAALELHPDVFEVAVFGIPSEEWGEPVHAIVVVRPGATVSADEVRRFAREHLACYKIPRSIGFIDELPKTGSGKILKRELRAPYWAGRTSRSAEPTAAPWSMWLAVRCRWPLAVGADGPSPSGAVAAVGDVLSRQAPMAW